MTVKSQKNKKFIKFLESLSNKHQKELLMRYKNEDLTIKEIFEKKYKRFINASPGARSLIKSKSKSRKRYKQTPKLGSSVKVYKNKRNYR